MKEKFRIVGKTLDYGLMAINVLVAFWLGLCFIASEVNPSHIKHIEVFSITTALAIIANFIFMLAWLFSRKKLRSILSLMTLVIAFRIIPSVFGFNYLGDNDMSRLTTTFQLFHWNVHGMGYFNPDRDKDADAIMRTIKQYSPDILCLPEFRTTRGDSMSPFTARIIRDNKFKDFRYQPDNLYGNELMGTAIFSKYRIIDYRSYAIGADIYLLQCDMLLPTSKVVRMFFTHLCSNYLDKEDLAYIEKMKTHKAMSEMELWRSRHLLWKFSVDYIERAKQADKADSIISLSPYPVLVCGDLNDLPASYAYTTIKGELNDAFTQKGKGFGRTYAGIFPTLRIDHIFYEPSVMHIIGYESPNLGLSDHFPLITNFEIVTPR